MRLYSCRHMADNCGRCRVVDSVYRCGWCSESKSCSVSDQCQPSTRWISRDQTCPDPAVIKVRSGLFSRPSIFCAPASRQWHLSLFRCCFTFATPREGSYLVIFPIMLTLWLADLCPGCDLNFDFRIIHDVNLGADPSATQYKH